MKSYKEIVTDIKSVLDQRVTGLQLDILVNTLAMYAYDIQSNAISQLLENNLDTAININSIIAKGAQYGVSAPRTTNPEVEFEVKSTGSTHTLYPGDEVISIGKFKFIYLGYVKDGSLLEGQVTINSNNSILVRCTVTDKVSEININQIPGQIYDYTIQNVGSKIFAYKDGNLLNVHESYSSYLSDHNTNKITSVTYPDYGVKLFDANEGDQSEYRIILPHGIDSLSELIGVIDTKASSKNVTASKTRSGSDSQNIKIVNLGSQSLSREDLVSYVERNLKLTQLIKSNSDLIEFFNSYLFSITGIRYNISFTLGSELVVYVNDQYFTKMNLNELIPRFYIGLESITVQGGTEFKAEVTIKLNNQVNDGVSSTISGYINEYNGKFNALIDEFDLVSKINSINPLISITEFSVKYKLPIQLESGRLIEFIFSRDNYTDEFPSLTESSPLEPNLPSETKVYKAEPSKDKYLKTNIIWK